MKTSKLMKLLRLKKAKGHWDPAPEQVDDLKPLEEGDLEEVLEKVEKELESVEPVKKTVSKKK